jgi:hypothetical protein
MQDIIIMLVLAFFTAGGVFLTMAACVNGQTVWPLVPILLGLLALLPICACGILRIDHDMPAHLADETDAQTGPAEVGWLFVGIALTCAWGCPLILARHSVLDMRVSWFASLGTWALIGTIGMFIVLLVKGQTSSPAYF